MIVPRATENPNDMVGKLAFRLLDGKGDAKVGGPGGSGLSPSA